MFFIIGTLMMCIHRYFCSKGPMLQCSLYSGNWLCTHVQGDVGCYFAAQRQEIRAMCLDVVANFASVEKGG